MRILFTGGSSFTGMWFVEALAAAGHQVVATMTRDGPGAYEGVRAERVARASEAAAETVYDCPLGSDRFLDVLRASSSWDLLSHHAADVTNYRSPDFDALSALGNNARRAREILADLAERGGQMLLTGSVFEGGEGAGSDDLPHFSRYGLSKALSAEVWQFEAAQQHVGASKFVIPNPFGPYEEPRFTAYLMRCWFKDEVAGVKTPEYVRDNIHVSLLAGAYAQFAQIVSESEDALHISPSGYVESQGRFAERLAAAMRARLGLACGLDLAVQTEFEEPRVRIGTEPVAGLVPGWSESDAWDEFAAYYARMNEAVSK